MFNRRLTLVPIALVALSGGLGAAWTASASAPAPAIAARAGAYTVDAVHSAVVFRVKHMNVAYFYGRFNKLSGSFLIDPANPGASEVEIVVDADSVDTNNQGRDRHLRGADFFSTKEFPTISFKASSFTKTGDNTYDVTGDLTLHGQTKPITVKLQDTGTGPGRDGGELAGIEATFTIKRSEFGMNYMLGALGDDITLMVGIEGAR